ncbi:Peptide-methionine (R)-S-oxide reductase [Mycena kentingensis (nom. inval.)]|nr:Peptide-methionine (R)-S-oxide reductase [Mycena kentingensis (nom. inval.)]
MLLIARIARHRPHISIPVRLAVSVTASLVALSAIRYIPPSYTQRRAMSAPSTPVSGGPGGKQKSEEEWRAVLSKEQFRVIRQKGTERAGSGAYEKLKDEGTYNCAACNTPLYKSTAKFDSGCGWPAFFDAIPGAVTRHVDVSWGMQRIEIVCTACGGHLGHVFKGEKFPTPTDERHCVNSVSLTFYDAQGVEKPQ